MAVIAIDLGTTGCKAGIFEGGKALGLAGRHYLCASPREGWAEQDAEEVWGLVKVAIREALAGAHPRPPVKALCVSVQGDAIIPIDSAYRALHPAILGMDVRSHKEAADLQEHFGRAELYSATGMPCEPLNAITKVLWLERSRPELRKSLWKYVHYEDYLLGKLCGKTALDFSMASRTMAFHPVEKRWISAVLDFVRVPPSRLGEPCPSGTPLGTVLRSVADELGIDPGAVVVSGAHDQCMAAIGAGVIEPGIGCYSMGTAEVIGACFPDPRLSRDMLDANYPCYLHAVPGQYFTITLHPSGGLSLEWFTTLWAGLAGMTEERRNSSYAELIAHLAVSPSPVMFLPHLVGSGTPTCDHKSRGAFVGLALKTSRSDMFQAVVDALAFEARLNLTRLQSQGIHVAELRAVGGGARSRKILELKATVLKRPIRTLQVSEAALLGAALVAEVAMGTFRDIKEGCRACVQIDQTIEPSASAAAAYDNAFERFCGLYEMLKPFHHQRNP